MNRPRLTALERENRARLTALFDNLKEVCSCVKSNRRRPSKQSILLAAKKECELLRHFEKKKLAEKKKYLLANNDLKSKLAKVKKLIMYNKPRNSNS